MRPEIMGPREELNQVHEFQEKFMRESWAECQRLIRLAEKMGIPFSELLKSELSPAKSAKWIV